MTAFNLRPVAVLIELSPSTDSLTTVSSRRCDYDRCVFCRPNSKRVKIVKVLFFCLYIGFYLANLRPCTFVNEGHLGIVIDGYREADYAVGGAISHAVFAPAHWLDRQVRPNYWTDASDDARFVQPRGFRAKP